MSKAFEAPRWLRDLKRYLPLKSQFVLSGNVRDLQATEPNTGTIAPQSFIQTLGETLREAGYAFVISYDPLSGLQAATNRGTESQEFEAIGSRLGLTISNGRATASIDLLSQTLERLTNDSGDPIALIIDFASCLTVRPDNLGPAEHQFFTRALVLSHLARSRPAGTNRQPYFNTILWVVEKEGDLPDFLLIDNPRIRHIPVSKPDHVIRRALAPALLRPLTGFISESDSKRQNAIEAFVESTEGMLLLDLNAIATLARVEAIPLSGITDAVRRYKVGVTEDPWIRIGHEKIQNAPDFISKRVKGQPQAVLHMLDIVKRAMTGIGGSRRGNRPRGVAFLAGPTGVGKTELAKTITSLLFGDETAYIRFDMSEFSAEHSDQRLIGAPPGYVGYDVGGELTNAIREKPFSVVLFDEIEKAHPKVLDKFLQILDDGVLTSGRGDRVYFSESLIVFTSNLGIYRLTDTGDRVPNVNSSEPYEVVKEKVTAEIRRHFQIALNRPELLNRIGENVIVFDFIRAEVAAKIFDQIVTTILNDLAEQGFKISLAEGARFTLGAACLKDLSNGGRGIRNQIEAHLINPLARSLFDAAAKPGDSFEVHSIEAGCISMERT